MAHIGLIGIGLMGHGIGKNLMEKGHDLGVVAHQNRAPIDDLIEKGAKEYDNPRLLTEAVDFVVICVTGSPQFQAIADGDDGFLAGFSTGKTVIDCTTGEPDVVTTYVERVTAGGGHFADCPLARTPVEAEAGKLNVMVGASDEVFRAVEPILSCFCESIFHVGPPGSGAQMKLIYNLITMGQAALIAEAVTACKAMGVDLKVFYDIISKGGGNSGIFQMIMPDFQREGSFDGMKFSIANATKDLRYYNRMTGTAGLAAPMGAAVYDRLITTEKLGFDDGLVGHLVAAALKLNGFAENAASP